MSWVQWDIASFEFPAPVGEHPVVITSNPDRLAHARLANVLYCRTQRQARVSGPEEVLLNTEDGLDWETFCRCDHIFSVECCRLKRRARPARVTIERRRQISDRIIQIFRLRAHA